MKRKIIIQISACILFFVGINICEDSQLHILHSGAKKTIEYMSVDYTAKDLNDIAAKNFEKVVAVVTNIDNAVDAITGKPVYSEPIDEKYAGEEASVHAVAGGKVTAVGKNESIGKYIQITHGDQTKSIYGNLNRIFVKKSQNVKRGQMIATYRNLKDKEFYYSLEDFK